MRDAGIWASKQKGLSTLTADTNGWEIDRRLDFRETDTLLVKKYASCFFGTDLGSRLVAQRVDTLIITGCTTSGCVRATAVDAVQYGFRPMVVREAIARPLLTRRAFSTSMRNTPTSSGSTMRCGTSGHSATIRPHD
jgi:nicotinamidase-related amidase